MRKSNNLLSELKRRKNSIIILSSKDLLFIKGGTATVNDDDGTYKFERKEGHQQGTLVGGAGIYIDNELE